MAACAVWPHAREASLCAWKLRRAGWCLLCFLVTARTGRSQPGPRRGLRPLGQQRGRAGSEGHVAPVPRTACMVNADTAVGVPSSAYRNTCNRYIFMLPFDLFFFCFFTFYFSMRVDVRYHFRCGSDVTSSF